MDDTDIKILNPSVNYEDQTNEDGFVNSDTLIKTYLRKKESKQYNKTIDEDTFYKYFSLIMAFIFMIIILNITFVAYKSIDPVAFDNCKSIKSENIIDVFSSVDDIDSAKHALIRWRPENYTFVEYNIENCGRNGVFAYYFSENNDTYIVCDDETIQYVETICKEPRFMGQLLIKVIT